MLAYRLSPLWLQKKTILLAQTKPMKNTLILCFVAVSFTCFGQEVDKLITEENVTRVIKTLSSDAMRGRPSTRPELIEPATAFIESEFKKIGLKPLKGLDGFRQSFDKERISTESISVTIDGEAIDAKNVLVISDKTEIELSSGLNVRTIAYDSTVKNVTQFFLGNASRVMRDTTSSLILVSPEFREGFEQLRSYVAARFTNKRNFVKVIVMGKSSASSYSIKVKQKLQQIKMANVVGMLEGKSKPGEFVIFSGHYDHLGIQKPVNGDSIFNGADDDASGTTAVIELARYFKKIKMNNRTLIFVAFTAEEIGGYGSKYFSEQLDPDKVVTMFNIEMIGKPSKWGQNAAFISGYERSDFGTILGKNLAGTPFSFKPDPYPQQNLFYRSDNATLARLGVPAHSISTDQIDSDKLYHTVDDEFETIDIKNVTATIRAIALSSKTIVDGTDTPKRIDKATVQQ
jgi:Zn-dependent M28 family amino/carboxypeptidase